MKTSRILIAFLILSMATLPMAGAATEDPEIPQKSENAVKQAADECKDDCDDAQKKKCKDDCDDAQRKRCKDDCDDD
jgi:hypothetical protein